MKENKGINTYGDDDWATPIKKEELRLTFSEWIKKQLTVEEVEERLNKRKDSESYVAPLRNGGIVVLDKGTKW